MQGDLILGVDGGETKTEVLLASVLADAPPEAYGRGVAGPSNPRAVGFDTAFANLDSAIDAAFRHAELPRDTVASACLCLAGVARPAERQRVEAWLDARRIAHRHRLAMDVEALLAVVTRHTDDEEPARDATDVHSGIALVAGTGSIAWGRSDHGDSVRCGGWGYLLGDEGSGYAIALAGLRHACVSADGRDQETRLLERLLTEFDCEKPPELIERIYAPDMTRKRIAEACRVVFECADGGDTVATEIVTSASRDLFQLVENVVGRLSFEGGTYALALGGGVLCQQPRFAAQVIDRLELAGITPRLWRTVDRPARGALILAAES